MHQWIRETCIIAPEYAEFCNYGYVKIFKMTMSSHEKSQKESGVKNVEGNAIWIWQRASGQDMNWSMIQYVSTQGKRVAQQEV